MNAKVVSNLEELSSIIGTFQGISEAANDERFIQQILVDANSRTLENFNIKAAAVASRTKNLNRNFRHMYEFGVAGITPGQTVIADPTSQAARLWVFKSIPSGRQVSTFVQFRDAVVPNPKPSQRPDLKKFNVSQDIINRMSTRKYVFKKRAEMTEYGKTVSISPYRAKALIFPSRENESGVGFWPRSAGKMRVSLDGEISNNSASKHKMAFTNFFLVWWNTDGETQARVSASNSVSARIGAAQRKAKKEKGMKPAKNTKVNQAAKLAAERAKKNMMKGGMQE